MSVSDRSGRRFQPELTALLKKADGGRLVLRAPAVGQWRGAPAPGEQVTAGAMLGEIEVLGALHRLRAPAGAHGIVVGDDPARGLARRPVAYGEVLCELDPEAAGPAAEAAAAAESVAASGALVFAAPSSGRFYGRPAPDQPPFVEPGDVLESGTTVCLLEVMKTFNRVTYGGADLPARARVLRVVPPDESDLDAGDVILELEPA